MCAFWCVRECEFERERETERQNYLLSIGSFYKWSQQPWPDQHQEPEAYLESPTWVPVVQILGVSSLSFPGMLILAGNWIRTGTAWT